MYVDKCQTGSCVSERQTDDMMVFVYGDVSLPLFLYERIVPAYLKLYKVYVLFLKLCLVSKEISVTEVVY